MTKQEWKQAKKATDAKASAEVKVGDVFVATWGYDQTNVNYFEVIGKTKAGVYYVPIPKAYEITVTDVYKTMPAVGEGDVTQKKYAKVQGHQLSDGIQCYIKVLGFTYAEKWEGGTVFETKYA